MTGFIGFIREHASLKFKFAIKVIVLRLDIKHQSSTYVPLVITSMTIEQVSKCA